MATFTDRVMLSVATPDALRELVFPAADPTHARMRQLVSALYTLPAVVVHDVLAVKVVETRFQRALVRRRELRGAVIQTTPAHVRTEICLDGPEPVEPEWVDISARLSVTLELELDPGRIESVRFGDIGTFASLAEFRAKFSYLDLDAFMDSHGITTVEELRDAYRYLLGEITLAQPPPFVAGDPAHQRRLDVPIAVLVRDAVDVAEWLRSVRRIQGLSERDGLRAADDDGIEPRAQLAPVVVFPATAPAAAGLAVADLTAFLAAQDVLAIALEP